jgi:hypothetical protein
MNTRRDAVNEAVDQCLSRGWGRIASRHTTVFTAPSGVLVRCTGGYDEDEKNAVEVECEATGEWVDVTELYQ